MNTLEMQGWIMILLELTIAVLLFIEYFYGRPDIVLKNEDKQRKRINITKQSKIVYEKEMD